MERYHNKSLRLPGKYRLEVKTKSMPAPDFLYFEDLLELFQFLNTCPMHSFYYFKLEQRKFFGWKEIFERSK
jgi:hypothetical protein